MLFAQDDNVGAQKAEEGFAGKHRRQMRASPAGRSVGAKYGAHGGLGMTNRGGRAAVTVGARKNAENGAGAVRVSVY